jgi:hypothetical protein
MNANSLKWFEQLSPAQGTQPRPGALQGVLARSLEIWIGATQRPSQVPELVRDLNEQAARYEATQPGYAADLRFAAQRALQAGDVAA